MRQQHSNSSGSSGSGSSSGSSSVMWRGVREQCVLVSGALSSSISSLVGPGLKLKSFIDEDGSGSIARSIVSLLDHLDVDEHPVGVAYKQMAEGYLNYVGESGLSSMLTLLGLLVKKGDILEQNGIPLINVLEGFRTAANVCEDTLHSIAIPFSTIIQKDQEKTKITLENDNLNNNNNNIELENGNFNNINFNRFTDDSFLSSPKKNKGDKELTDMLAKFGITNALVVPELEDGDDDVSWFFDGDGADADNFEEKNNLDNNFSSFGENELLARDSSVPKEEIEIVDKREDIIEIIGRGLAHGNEDMMAIAVRVAQLLEDEWEMTRVLKLKVNFEHSSVTNGLVIPVNENHSIATCSCKGVLNPKREKDNPLIGQEMNTRQWCGRVVVLDGDAGFTEYFQGAEREIHATQFEQVMRQREQDDEKYNQTALSMLKNNDVKLVIASGEIKQSLAEKLHAHGIHTIDIILTLFLIDNWNFICGLIHSIPIGDILDITDDFLSPFVRVETFGIGGKWKQMEGRRFKTQNLEFKQELYVRITRIEDVNRPVNFPISVVLGGATKAIAEEKERQFMNCLYKLRNSCQLEQILPGGGFSELRCILALEEKIKEMMFEGSAESSRTVHYVLYEAEGVKGFMECIEQYLLVLAQNMGINSQDALDVVAKLKRRVMEQNNNNKISLYHHNESGDENKETETIYDDMLAKIESFQRAVIATSTILNIKTMIIEKKNLTNVKINSNDT